MFRGLGFRVSGIGVLAGLLCPLDLIACSWFLALG